MGSKRLGLTSSNLTRGDLAQVGSQIVDALRRGVPGKHEAGAAAAAGVNVTAE